MTKETYLTALLPSYKAYFDIALDTTEGDRTYPATAKFHSRSEKYVLVKAAKLWATEMNEYVYFAYGDVPSVGEFLSLKEDVLKTGLGQIKPHSEHMYSYVTFILIADLLSADVIKEIEKAKHYQSYWFSLQGWMHLRIGAVDLSNGTVYTNHQGRELLPMLNDILATGSKKQTMAPLGT